MQPGRSLPDVLLDERLGLGVPGPGLFGRLVEVPEQVVDGLLVWLVH
jgi:hypothetical protein